MTDQTTSKPISTADMAAAGQRAEAVPNATEADSQSQQRPAANAAQPDGAAMALLEEREGGSFRSRWALIQAGFVDEPRTAVEQGDALVAELMQRLAEVFAQERGRLESQWTSGSDVSTEDLRLALRRYRSFFDRLLSL